MHTIIFHKTGNFWIDNGIVGLAKVLKVLSERSEPKLSEFSSSLTHDKLSLSIESETELFEDAHILFDVLNAARDFVSEQYLKSTGVGWIYKEKEKQFEIYRKTDFKMHLKPFFTGKTPKTEGALCVPGTKESDMGSKGRRMTEVEYSAFSIFKDANSPVQIGDKKYPLTGKGFLNTPPKHAIGNIFSPDYLAEGKKICAFSGSSYKNIREITGMDFPFLTSMTGELNFASYLAKKPKISAKFSFVALFAFYNLSYQIGKNLKNYFVLYDNDLKALNSFLSTLQQSAEQAKNADYCNFETVIIGVQYEAESLFNFLISVYKQVIEILESDTRKEIYRKKVFTLSNDDNIFRHVEEYGSLEAFFHLLDSFSETGDEHNYFENFLNFIRWFNQKNNKEWDTTWRNKLCADMLHFRSIHKIVELFLGEVKMKEATGSIPYLDKIILIYNKKTQPKMNTKMVEMCKSLGNRIGRYCRESQDKGKSQDKGILFSIRNAKTRSEFLSVLSETQFRTEVLYSEDFFKELPDNAQWEEYKSLVSIFAMNSFLYTPEKNQTNPHH